MQPEARSERPRLSGRVRGALASRLAQSATMRVTVPQRANGPWRSSPQAASSPAAVRWKTAAPGQATGYKARCTRSASSRSAMTAVGSLPICLPMRSTATDRICSACAFESWVRPV
jgi:hypothetical protein